MDYRQKPILGRSSAGGEGKGQVPPVAEDLLTAEEDVFFGFFYEFLEHYYVIFVFR